MACEDCFKGVIWEGEPTGTISKFAGVDTYFAKTPGQTYKSAIVLSTDVFGIFTNSQLVADAYHRVSGLLVIIPDLFNGDALKESQLNVPDPFKTVFPPWIAKHQPDTKFELLEKVFSELREKEGIEKIGVIGFCYGAKMAIHFAHSNKINAVGAAHPSFLKTPEDIEAIQVPSIWLFAETDQAFSNEARAQTEEILKKKQFKSEFKFFPGTTHGFAIRGGENEQTKQAKDKAAEDAGKFFKEVL